MDNVAIVVEDIEAAKAFFLELGMEFKGGQTVEGPWVDGTVGLTGVRSEIAMMAVPGGGGRIELTQYHRPLATTVEPSPPANTLGLHRIMFAVDDIRDTVERLKPHGGEVLGEIAQYEEMFLLCYLRGPQGIIVALAEEISE